MAHYAVNIFAIPLHNENYYNQRYASIQDSQYADALRSLIQADVIQYDTNINPTATLSRAELIEQIVKSYALSNKVLLTSTAHDLADIDGSDPVSALIVFAYEQ